MNIELIKSLAKLAKVDNVEEFTQALQSEKDESTYDFSNLIVRTKEDDETMKTNLLDSSKSKIFKDAFEIQIKNMKKDLGLEFEGKKSEDFIDAFKTSILKDAKIEPNKKIEELQTSLGKVQGLLTEKENEIDSLQSSYKQKETKLQAQSYFPTLPESIGLNQAEATSLYFMSHEIKDDGIYKNGERQKDDHEKVFDLKQSIEAFVSEKKWNATPSGRGGGAGKSGGEPNGKPKTIEEYESYIKDKGINPASVEANALLQGIVEQSN